MDGIRLIDDDGNIFAERLFRPNIYKTFYGEWVTMAVPLDYEIVGVAIPSCQKVMANYRAKSIRDGRNSALPQLLNIRSLDSSNSLGSSYSEDSLQVAPTKL